jgi:26S proteasome regulatory subunit T6
LLREEMQVLQEPGSYVGEVIKVMGKKKVLVKVQPEGKYGQSLDQESLNGLKTDSCSGRLF